MTTAHRSLAVALAAVIDVEVGLAAIAARPHLTTACLLRKACEACTGFCSCEDCTTPCECGCHDPA